MEECVFIYSDWALDSPLPWDREEGEVGRRDFEVVEGGGDSVHS